MCVLGGGRGDLLELGFESWGSRLRRRLLGRWNGRLPTRPAARSPGWLLPRECTSCVLPPHALGHRRPAFPSAQPGPCVSTYRPCLGGLSCTQIGRLSGRGSDLCCSRDHPRRGLCSPARGLQPVPHLASLLGHHHPWAPSLSRQVSVMRSGGPPVPLRREFPRRPGGSGTPGPGRAAPFEPRSNQGRSKGAKPTSPMESLPANQTWRQLNFPSLQMSARIQWF